MHHRFRPSLGTRSAILRKFVEATFQIRTVAVRKLAALITISRNGDKYCVNTRGEKLLKIVFRGLSAQAVYVILPKCLQPSFDNNLSDSVPERVMQLWADQYCIKLVLKYLASYIRRSYFSSWKDTRHLRIMHEALCLVASLITATTGKHSASSVAASNN